MAVVAVAVVAEGDDDSDDVDDDDDDVCPCRFTANCPVLCVVLWILL